MKYRVDVVYEGLCVIDVEANNKEEAVKEAKRIALSRIPPIGYADLYTMSVRVLTNGVQAGERPARLP